MKSWALQALAHHPETQDRPRRELQNCDELRHQDILLPRTLANELGYLDAVLLETYRLHTGVPYVERGAQEDDCVPLSTPITLRNGKQLSSINLRLRFART